MVPAAGDAPSRRPSGHAGGVGGARGGVGDDDRSGASTPRTGAARVRRRRVVVRPDAAPPRLRHGQVVHGADPRGALPPDAGCRTRAPSTSRGPGSTARRRCRSPKPLPCGRIERRASPTTSPRSPQATSSDRSTCSRTAPTRCATASIRCSRRSSGTIATRGGTSPGWGRIHRRRERDEAVLRRRAVRRPAAAHCWQVRLRNGQRRRVPVHRVADHAGRPRQLVRRVVGFADGLAPQAERRVAAGHTVSASEPAPPGGRVLPPGVLLASRRPRRPRAHHRLRRQREGVPGGAAAPRTARHASSRATPRATSSPRPATGRSRRSSTSAATTARRRSSTRRCTRLSIAAGRSSALDGPGTGSVLYERRQPKRPDWENVVPGMVDLVAGPARGRPRAARARRPLVRWTAGPARRSGRAAAGGDGRRPGPVRHGGRVRRAPRRPVEVGRRPAGRRAVRRAAGHPGDEGAASDRAW